MVNSDIIENYFPEISAEKLQVFSRLYPIYEELNAKVNLISRKDFENFYIHHVLHSLALAKFCEFKDGINVIDIGTGGGFPGIPLAIMYPNVHFTLVDSIAKKIRAVDDVIDIIGLKNVKAFNTRTELVYKNFDVAVARAVAPMSDLWNWMQTKWIDQPCFYLLKGGDLSDEMSNLLELKSGLKFKQHAISSIFSEPFFETKKVVEIK